MVKTTITTIQQEDAFILYIYNNCGFNCSFPNGAQWCDEKPEIFLGNSQIPQPKGIVEIADLVRNATNTETFHFGGIEPLYYREIKVLMNGLRGIGYKNFAITTQGMLLEERIAVLVESGVRSITISVHSLDERTYRQITRRGNLSRVMRGIYAALGSGINVSVNRVLMKGVNDSPDDLKGFFNWCAEYGITAKLYRLLKSERIDLSTYLKMFVDPKSVIQGIEDRVLYEEIRDLPNVKRKRHYLHLDWHNRPLTVVYDEFGSKMDVLHQICQQCPNQVVCEEGLFGYGLKVNFTPTGIKVQPCYRDMTPPFDLGPYLNNPLGLRQKLITLGYNFQSPN